MDKKNWVKCLEFGEDVLTEADALGVSGEVTGDLAESVVLHSHTWLAAADGARKSIQEFSIEESPVGSVPLLGEVVNLNFFLDNDLQSFENLRGQIDKSAEEMGFTISSVEVVRKYPARMNIELSLEGIHLITIEISSTRNARLVPDCVLEKPLLSQMLSNAERVFHMGTPNIPLRKEILNNIRAVYLASFIKEIHAGEALPGFAPNEDQQEAIDYLTNVFCGAFPMVEEQVVKTQLTKYITRRNHTLLVEFRLTSDGEAEFVV